MKITELLFCEKRSSRISDNLSLSVQGNQSHSTQVREQNVANKTGMKHFLSLAKSTIKQIALLVRIKIRISWLLFQKLVLTRSSLNRQNKSLDKVEQNFQLRFEGRLVSIKEISGLARNFVTYEVFFASAIIHNHGIWNWSIAEGDGRSGLYSITHGWSWQNNFLNWINLRNNYLLL